MRRVIPSTPPNMRATPGSWPVPQPRRQRRRQGHCASGQRHLHGSHDRRAGLCQRRRGLPAPTAAAVTSCAPYGTRAEFTDLDAQLAGGEVPIDLLETSLACPPPSARRVWTRRWPTASQFRRSPVRRRGVLSALHRGAALRAYRPQGHLTIDDEADRGLPDVPSAMAGPMAVSCPEADPADGWLDVMMIVRRWGG